MENLKIVLFLGECLLLVPWLLYKRKKDKYKPKALKMNSLQQRIYDLEQDRDLLWFDSILLKILHKKSEELGKNPTKKQAAQAVMQAEKELDEYLRKFAEDKCTE